MNDQAGRCGHRSRPIEEKVEVARPASSTIPTIHPSASEGSLVRPGQSTSSWSSVLRHERQRLRLTQVGAARRAAVSVDALRKYERGERTPSASTIRRLLERLEIPIEAQKRILGELRLTSAHLVDPVWEEPGFFLRGERLRALAERLPWPHVVLDGAGQPIVVNSYARLVWESAARSRWGRDDEQVAATDIDLASRAADWDRSNRELLGFVRAAPSGAVCIRRSLPIGDRLAPPRGFGLFEPPLPLPGRIRWSFPLTIHATDGHELSFTSIVAPADLPEQRSFQDWIPRNASTARWLADRARSAGLQPEWSSRARLTIPPGKPSAPTPNGDTDWSSLLRQMRRSRGLTQAGLAQRAAISTDSVRRYEAGNRQPSTASMSRLADALELHGSRRRSFFDSAGVDEAPPPDQEIGIDGYETVSVEIETILDAVPWPSFVAGDIMDLVAANRAAEMLWDVDLSAEFKRRSRAEVSFLSIAAERRFATRIVNWEEPVAALISVLKAMPRTSLMLDDASPLLSDVLEAFAENDPGALGRLFTLWESTPPAEAAIRWGFPITWNDPRVGELRFLNLVDAISAVDGFSFNAWLPRDAETVARWQELEARSRPISQRRP